MSLDTINVIKYMNEFREILAYASNIGFFFGAGTSCAFGLPTIAKLTTDVKEKLTDDDQKLLVGIDDHIKTIKETTNVTVEDELNFLKQIRALTNDNPDYNFKDISG